MPPTASSIAITGMGVLNALGTNLSSFTEALRASRSGITSLQGQAAKRFPPPHFAAPLPDWNWKNHLAPKLKQLGRTPPVSLPKLLRTASLSLQCSLDVAAQASLQARSETFPSAERMGLIVGGSNLSPLLPASPSLPHPRHAFEGLDTHWVGLISELLNLQGPGFTVGGAAASGHIALERGMDLLLANRVDLCFIVGPSTDFSCAQWQTFQQLGALIPQDFVGDTPSCPFDREACGFVPGEGTACIILEKETTALARGASPLARILAAKTLLEPSHLPTPSALAEIRVMQTALQAAQLSPQQIGYLNPHATSTPAGDLAEAQAIQTLFGSAPSLLRINMTKALLGHTFFSASLMEIIATILQMQEGFLHGNPHLRHPILPDLPWVGATSEKIHFDIALSNAFGFAGIHTCVLLQRPLPQ